MKKFKFRLQTLLEQRKAREDELLGELAEVRREEALEEARLIALRTRLANACTALQQALERSESSEILEMYDEYSKALRDDVRVQELTLEAVRQRVEQKRLDVIKAMQERKVLETLRDKQEAAFLKAAARAEQIEMDDMASLRFARGM